MGGRGSEEHSTRIARNGNLNNPPSDPGNRSFFRNPLFKPPHQNGVLLRPKNGEDIVINAWNWRPTLELLRDAELIDDDLIERMGTHGCKAEVDATTACRIADFIELRLCAMKPEDRVLADLTVTDKPKKRVIFAPGTKPEEIDAIDLLFGQLRMADPVP